MVTRILSHEDHQRDFTRDLGAVSRKPTAETGSWKIHPMRLSAALHMAFKAPQWSFPRKRPIPPPVFPFAFPSNPSPTTPLPVQLLLSGTLFPSLCTANPYLCSGLKLELTSPDSQIWVMGPARHSRAPPILPLWACIKLHHTPHWNVSFSEAVTHVFSSFIYFNCLQDVIPGRCLANICWLNEWSKMRK